MSPDEGGCSWPIPTGMMYAWSISAQARELCRSEKGNSRGPEGFPSRPTAGMWQPEVFAARVVHWSSSPFYRRKVQYNRFPTSGNGSKKARRIV